MCLLRLTICWSCYFLVFYLIRSAVFGFNVDRNFPVVLNGAIESYFGYSVALHRNNEGVIALVAAPKANSSIFGRLVFEPGVLYKCQLTNQSCNEVVLERSGNTVRRKGTEYSYYDKKDGMWLGVSLDVQQEGDGNVVTCGHLWKNQMYEQHYLPNGVCYVLNRDLQQSSVSKLIPLVDRSKQSIIPPGIYYYALGQAGMSAAFSETGQDLLLGAPGFYDWIGTVVNYKVPTHPQNIERPTIPNPPGDQNPSPEAYIGYSVTSGHFFELSGTSYVAGAPRDRMNVGRVYIFEALGLAKNRIVTQHKMEGEQLGAYFGAVVLGVNLNNDDYTDLLVSAPMYSMNNAGDEGRVYVYVSDGVGLQRQTTIMGSKIPGSRFGTAVANAGDLNQDGFTDVVIGAPYENYRGAIYIYHGMQNGLKNEYSQKIPAEDISSSLRGFGLGLARAMDVDDNRYPDLLVGAYASNNAVVLRTHPVIQIRPKLDFDVTQIDTNVTRCTRGDTKVPCFKVTACLRYTGKNVPAIMDLLTVLELDPMTQRTQRAYFRFENKSSSSLSQGTSLQVDVENCFQRDVIIYDDIQDYISPLMVRLRFSLSSNRPETRNTFCNSCPVLDPSMPTSVTREISFRNGCGEDNTCMADLKVRAVLTGYREEALILGANKSLDLDISVANKGEPAFGSVLLIRLPPAVKVINQAQCHIQEGAANSSMECKLGNPMHAGAMVKFTIRLDVSKVDINVDALLFELVASTTSQEKNPKDDTFILRVPVVAVADITIIGTAQREQIIYGKQNIVDIVHTYVVLKYLPSPVRSAGVAIFLPIIDKRTSIQFMQLDSVEIGDGKSTVPGSCNATLAEADFTKLNERPLNVEETLPAGSKDTPNTINLIGSGEREKKINEAKPATGGHYYVEKPSASGRQGHLVNCSNSICTILLCSVGPFLDNTKVAIIQIRATANVTALKLAQLDKHENISIVTEGKVWIRDYKYDPQPDNHRPDYDLVLTSLIKEGLPAEPIATWIIAVSIVAGILLFSIILLALVKMGFFRREKMEEMKEKMNEETLLDGKAPPSDGPEDAASSPKE